VMLIVDEAHRLTNETLEEIRLLTNFETETRKLLQIVLSGQHELGHILENPEMRQLKQRIEVRLEIACLKAEEVSLYVRHRWSRASAADCPFRADATQLVALMSGGIPRLVNAICDNSLLIAFAENSRTVERSHVMEACDDLRVVPPTRAAGEVHVRTERPPSVNEADPLWQSTAEGNGPAIVRTGNPLSIFSVPAPKPSWSMFRKADKARTA